ncbi:MAG: hydroxyethylthiazole kinase [Clostridia bacterium]|nr:hydroxyethylthiazole kinase [Clostridia bacterium]
MTAESANKILQAVRETAPLVHCITNPISIHLCANGILAVGARPIMAEHPGEVAEITATASALLLNLGNITDSRMESMLLSGTAARKRGIPIVLDAVGAACSRLRRSFAKSLISQVSPTVIKGNYSEILALSDGTYESAGVDTDPNVKQDMVFAAMRKLSAQNGAIILASGKTDLIMDRKTLIRVQNGTTSLSRITGTGCLLGALTACFLSARPDICGAATACVVLGISGETADTEKGAGTFTAGLLDALSTLDDKQIKTLLKTEESGIENI